MAKVLNDFYHTFVHLPMARFHSLTIADVRKETDDCVSVSFEIPEDLRSEYTFIQGQYLTLKMNINGEELRRSYSICSSPVAESELRVAVKRVKGGKGSNLINDTFKKGDRVEVMTPMGNFYSRLLPANAKKYFLFAGGSGITPMLSIIRSVLHTEKKSLVSLFYGNLDERSTIFLDALKQISADSAGKFKLYLIYDKPGQPIDPKFKGMLTKEKVAELFDSYCGEGLNHEYFVCGPGPMMDNVRAVIEEKKVPKNQFHIEYFTAAVNSAQATAQTGEVINSKVTVSMYGIDTSFELRSDGKSILDAALEAGVDVPYACKGAVCCTCRGKIIEGKVKMDQNFALTDNEVEQGFILTCQSHPLTKVVKVDYDS